MKGKTKPWFGAPRGWHPKVEVCLEERRGEGQRSSFLGTGLLTTAAIQIVSYSSLHPVQFRWLQVKLSHYSHQLYSELLGAPFISTIHVSGITEAMAFTKGR